MTMTIFCIHDNGNGVMTGIVCDGRLASDIDDEEFITYHGADGAICQIRQRGTAIIASNPTDALAESTVDGSLLSALQNATEFELKDFYRGLEGHFLCTQAQFVERQQVCNLELTTGLASELPTLIRALDEMRAFEAMLYGEDADTRKSNSKVARLSEDLAARATNLRLREGLFIPVCFRYQDTDINGAVEICDSLGYKAIVRWVNGPAELASGTQILIPSESDTPWRFAMVF